MSSFDDKGKLLVCNGAVHTDKTLDNLIKTLYHGILEKFPNSKLITCDVVETIEVAKEHDKLSTLDMKEYGLCIINEEGNKSGVILPDTAGVADFNNALYHAQHKNHITGTPTIYIFTTKRMVIENV